MTAGSLPDVVDDDAFIHIVRVELVKSLIV